MKKEGDSRFKKVPPRVRKFERLTCAAEKTSTVRQMKETYSNQEEEDGVRTTEKKRGRGQRLGKTTITK